MRLIAIANRYYLSVLIVIFIIGSIAAYVILKSILNNEFNQKLLAEKEQLIFELHNFETIQESYKLNIGDRIEVEEVNFDPKIEAAMQDTTMYDPYEKKELPFRTLKFSDKFNDKHHIITITKSLLPNQDLIEGITEIMIALMIVLAISLGLLNRVIFLRLWHPFEDILNQLNEFNLSDPRQIEIHKNKVHEFEMLKDVINSMIIKSINDYRRLKEYTENTTHEIQTPLAIIKNKSELLLQENLSEEQFREINSIYKAAGRLSRLKEGLSIISKIENNQFMKVEKIDIVPLIKDRMEQFQELADLKSIQVTIDLPSKYVVSLNPDLSYILFSNLLSNALKHNLQDGSITISLKNDCLRITNTGEKPEIPTEKLFERFARAKNKADSTGLGLSLVKVICDLSFIKVDYTFENSLHKISLYFKNLLQN